MGETGSRVLPAADYASVLEMARSDGPGVVVEATPTNLETGEPGLSNLRTALDLRYSAVSLAKGPLVVAFGELSELARVRGAQLRYSGAVAAALPTVDTAVYAMAGAGIREIEGVLNGTSNYILNGMAGASPTVKRSPKLSLWEWQRPIPGWTLRDLTQRRNSSLSRTQSGT